MMEPSYLTKRRKINAKVSAHLAYIEEANLMSSTDNQLSCESDNEVQSSITGVVQHSSAVSEEAFQVEDAVVESLISELPASSTSSNNEGATPDEIGLSNWENESDVSHSFPVSIEHDIFDE